ncbi:hypothetical protein MHYMCMPSP_00883, partial [Hyalomma marginatum]
VVTKGEEFAEKTSKSLKFVANNLKPLSLIHLESNKDKLFWVRRSRGYSSWADFADTPLNEEKEICLVTVESNTKEKQESITVEKNSCFIGNQSP